ncbi:hypothetical protein DFH08DRAFT_423831 [Mycena albidolilacea]|uniref:Zn(2)-C6 fungal-type domain-containing protein n=1 Tax=Mycena albidolilacea TaxID=1033008 RepID=A0AAD7EDN0_9AGAR|nr:hypothetical protein DFH08DRAFT_423831 [Mycena albidolilacea]
MPSAPLSPKCKPKASSTAEGDHRKRRRNRTTQSCLNCHATKRMCDRKRPCSRCSQLGLTGNCVYEVDDPNRPGPGQQDDEIKMMSRIAELEGVIRELKNKPHPRWLAEKDQTSSSDGSHTSPASSAGPSTPEVPAWSFPTSSLPSPSSFPFPTQSPLTLPSYEKDSMESFLAMYGGLSEHMYIGRGGCVCLTEGACYNVVLELSARLRQAAETLARSPYHANNSTCGLNTRVSALDALANDSLLGLSNHSLGGGPGCGNSPISPPLFDQFYPNNETPFAWDMDDIPGYNDDLMSWIPTHSNM